MRGFLSVLLFVMVPSWLFAQGGVTTTDDYDAGARSPELFQPGEEAEALLLMPLQAYPSAFSSLSDFNFSFVRYNRRGYDSRYSMLAVDGIALDDPLTGNQHWNVLNAVTNAPGPLFLAEGGAPGERMLGLSGGIREYGRPSGWMNSRGSRRPFRRSAMPVTFANTISTFCTSRPAAVQAGCLPTAVSAAGRGWAPLPDG